MEQSDFADSEVPDSHPCEAPEEDPLSGQVSSPPPSMAAAGPTQDAVLEDADTHDSNLASFPLALIGHL